jgi:hypothetical protein
MADFDSHLLEREYYRYAAYELNREGVLSLWIFLNNLVNATRHCFQDYPPLAYFMLLI